MFKENKQMNHLKEICKLLFNIQIAIQILFLLSRDEKACSDGHNFYAFHYRK